MACRARRRRARQRKLAQMGEKRIRQETDPQKVFALARQLFAEFENEKLPGGLPPEAG